MKKKHDHFWHNRRNSLDDAQFLRIDGNTPLNLPRLNLLPDFGNLPLRSPRVNFPLPSKLILKIIVFTPNPNNPAFFPLNPRTRVSSERTAGAVMGFNRIGRIRRDISVAQNLWNIDIYTTVTAIPNPGIIASDITTTPLNSVAFGLRDTYSEPGVITVIYVPGRTLNEGAAATSFYTIYHSSRLGGTLGGTRRLGGTIILADVGNNPENSSLFAHEVGHNLFYRIENGAVTDINPGSERLKDKTHSDPNTLAGQTNLMYFRPGVNTNLNADQKLKALGSPLLVFDDF
ncbi:hypothetical protein [Gottfriedia acidiceleris]|uniref:hypothetical protein n=1 Tax=Gottfriedia acidiceleris TaxID=371036 RepID=UPI0030003BAA